MSTDDEFEDYNPPADRFLVAQMWWIASELVRRHPHLLISRVHGVERSPLLLVHDEQDGLRIQFDLVGGVLYRVAGDDLQISWIEILAAVSPHEIVKRIEVESGIQIPGVTPATTPKALAYRVIASFLATVVNDRHEWNVVRAPMALDEDPDDPADDYLRAFPSTSPAISGYVDYIQEAAGSGTVKLFHQPFWALLRDLEPIAIIDIAGVIHTIVEPEILMPFYLDMNHHLSLTAARFLGPYMP